MLWPEAAQWPYFDTRNCNKTTRPAAALGYSAPWCRAPSRGDEPKVDDNELRARLEALLEEHRDLDAAIEAIRALPSHDQLQLARMKKRKLRLKDEISMLQDHLLPDIIA